MRRQDTVKHPGEQTPHRRRWRSAGMVATTLVFAVGLGVAPAASAPADEKLAAELKQDVILRAMTAELQRGIDGLKLEGMERPYFIEYAVRDAASVQIVAELGAVIYRNESPVRGLRVDVRVGSYELDNTNSSTASGTGGIGAVKLPIENDYNAIRQALWWAADRDYKQVVEDLARKKAFMETKIIADKPADHSREAPVIDLEDRRDAPLPVDLLERLAVELSAVFRDYPDIQESRVRVRAAAGNKYLVNTEGTRLRTTRAAGEVVAAVSVQADDGMKLSDSLTVILMPLEDMPSTDALKRRCRDLAERLVRIKNAPKMEEAYVGPVLLEAAAAVSLFERVLGKRFAGGQRPVGSSADPDDFEQKLNKRILPRFVNVVDDPTLETIAGEPVLAHYRYDDEGVAARAVPLVENGKLQALVMSRNPSKEFKNSTGHGRGVYRPGAAIGCLVVSAGSPDAGSDSAALKAQLLEACDDEGLEYGIRIASLSRGAPVEMYKVYPDGREQLVRGANSVSADLRAFKRMLAVGNTPHVMNLAGRQASRTVVAPAMLFEELDLSPIDRDFDRPPILPSPLAREGIASGTRQ